MLERDEDHPRRAVALPVASEAPAASRRVAEAARRAQREMALVVHGGIAHVGMLVVLLGQQDGCSHVYGMPPPLRENGALHLDTPHVWIVVRHRHRWNHLVGDEPDRRSARGS